MAWQMEREEMKLKVLATQWSLDWMEKEINSNNFEGAELGNRKPWRRVNSRCHGYNNGEIRWLHSCNQTRTLDLWYGIISGDRQGPSGAFVLDRWSEELKVKIWRGQHIERVCIKDIEVTWGFKPELTKLLDQQGNGNDSFTLIGPIDWDIA